MFGGVVGDNMKRMKRREKQENKNIFKMMFPPKMLKLMRVPKDWVTLLYFVLDGYSTLWWIMFIFHNFLQNNISDKLQNLQVDFRSSSSKFFFFLLSICPNSIYFISGALPIPKWVLQNIELLLPETNKK